MKSINRELSQLDINTKYVCMASLSGLLKYLETNSNIILENECLKINYHYLENYLNINFKTTLDLELLLNSTYLKTFSSLFSMFKCQTISGFRLLRSNILQPLTNEKDLNQRYDAVEELRGKTEILGRIKSILIYFKDLEISISKFILKNFENTEVKMKLILFAICNIKKSLQNLPALKELISTKLNSTIFKSFNTTFEEKVFSKILDNIDELLENIDFPQINNRNSNQNLKKNELIIMMIKSGLNNVLDVSRKTYSDTISEIYSIYERIKAVNNDPHLRLMISESLGFYLILSEEYYNDKEFILLKKIGKKIHCSNATLISLSERIKEIKKDIIEISLNLCQDLILFIQKNLNYLFVLSSIIALLDVICSLSDYAKNSNNLCRPKIMKINSGQTENLVILKNSRHPVLEKGLVNPYYLVPNDYFLCRQFNILLIRGANSSGKTTYMKQLGLTIILAQIGCLVPADYMCFTPRNFLYTKFGHNDYIEENKGSFDKEIVDIQMIISNNNQNALILLDEPFDTTISSDAIALSWSILEHFVENYKNSFILISNHNNIFFLSQFYLNVSSGVLESTLNSKFIIN